MIERFQDANPERITLVLRPNCSLGWPWMKLCWFFLLGCLTLVGGYFALQGAWLVLPFSGLEALVLGAGFYLHSRSAARREVIQLTATEVELLAGGREPRRQASFSRPWARVYLVRDPKGWYPSRLLIGSHGRFREIGSALVETERVRLAQTLQRLVSTQPLEATYSGTECLTESPPAPQQIQL